jgi:hypothetical protein
MAGPQRMKSHELPRRNPGRERALPNKQGSLVLRHETKSPHAIPRRDFTRHAFILTAIEQLPRRGVPKDSGRESAACGTAQSTTRATEGKPNLRAQARRLGIMRPSVIRGANTGSNSLMRRRAEHSVTVETLARSPAEVTVTSDENNVLVCKSRPSGTILAVA